MNISPHLLIDALILSAALTITLVLRSKGNAERKKSKWILKKDKQELKNPKLLKIWKSLVYVSLIAIGSFLIYLYTEFIFINKANE